jgi:hypothetical protein
MHALREIVALKREGIFQPVLGESAAAQHGSRVIDQEVDARLLGGYLSGHVFHLRNVRQISVMDRVTKA